MRGLRTDEPFPDQLRGRLLGIRRTCVLAPKYAEYARAFGRYVAKVPAKVDPLEAAPLTCAGVTTYKAIKLSGARPSTLVAIFGVGGLGHMAVQYAKIAGAAVVAVDLTDEKLELAKQLGADYTVNGAKEDTVEAIKKPGGADAAIS